MHAFNLTVGSLLRHPWAQKRVKRVLRLVAYFQASTRAYHKLLEGAKGLGIKGRLRNSNIICITSIQMVLGSVVGVEAAVAFLLNNQGSVNLGADTPPIIRARVAQKSSTRLLCHSANV